MATYYVRTSSAGGDGTADTDAGATAAFATLALAEDALDGVLTEPMIIQCSVGSGSAADGAVTFAGWTTSAANYLEVKAKAGEEATAKWDATHYRIEGANASAFLGTLVNYLRLTGLQIRVTAVASNTDAGIYITGLTSGANDIRVSRCLAMHTHGGTTYRSRAVLLDDPDGVVSIWNCVLVSPTGQDNTSSAAISTYGTVSIYSSILIGSYYGLRVASGTTTAKNCYASGATDGYSVAGTLNQTTCAASDDTAADAALDNIACDNDTFVDATNADILLRDFHLAADGASPLVGVGTDTSGEDAPLNFADDIDGVARGAVWDIGAAEYVAAGGNVVPLLITRSLGGNTNVMVT